MRVTIAALGCLIALGLVVLVGLRGFRIRPGAAARPATVLTLVARYPFYFSGSAPRRLLAHERYTK